MVLEKTLERPLSYTEITSVKPKGKQPEYSLEGLMLKLRGQYFGHLLQRTDSLEKSLMLGKIEGRRIREQQRMRCLDGIINSMDMSLSKLQEMVKDREAWHAVVHGWQRVGHDRATEQLYMYTHTHTHTPVCVFSHSVMSDFSLGPLRP